MIHNIMIKTWNKHLDKQLQKDYRFIGIFDSIKSFPKNAGEWNRAILIGWNSFEYQDWKWIDLGLFILPQWVPGVPWRDWMDWISPNEENIINAVSARIPKPKDWINGKDWVSPSLADVVEELLPRIPKLRDGKDGKDGKDWISPKIDYKQLAWEVFSLMKQDKEFLDSIHWKDGKNGTDWKDWIAPTLNDIIGSLVNNITFIQKCSIKWDKGEDWISPSLKDILYAIKSDKEFIKACSIKWDKGDPMRFEDLSKEQLKKITWPAGEWLPWTIWPSWRDGDRIYITYSPDWLKDFTYKVKPGDRFLSIQVWRQEPQIFQIVF